MKIKILLLCLLLIFAVSVFYSYAGPQYREIRTSLGKVIVGLTIEAALERFGSPASATENIWYYSSNKGFFVYFPSDLLLSIQIYPQFCEASLGIPLEFKAFGCFTDLKVKDITSQVQFLFSEPQNFVSEKPGIVVLKKAGEYQILAKYKNIFSNPSYITIKGPQEKSTEKEKLLSMDVLPFRPKVPPESKLDFTALGTFLDSSRNKYLVKDITREVMWFIQKDKDVTNARDKQIYFPSTGKFKVLCKYQNLESFPQEVEAQNNLPPFKQTLKHITLLPEFMFIASGSEVTLKAYGSYYNNRVEDITSRVKWRISDKGVIAFTQKGELLSKSEGVAEVIAELDELESLAAKIVVVGQKESLSVPATYMKPKEKEKKIDSGGLMSDIKATTETLSRSLLEKEKTLKFIKITPDYLRVPLGEKRQLTASGIYSDGSQANLTFLGEWISSDNKVARVTKGKVDAKSPGEAKIYIKFKGTSSLPASVIVEGPNLVSIIISPQNSQISMRGSLNLKAEGYFTDSSRKDITATVNWEITNPRIIKIEKGLVRPQRIGQTQVRAEYLKVRSLPADIRVIVTKGWLMYIIIKIVAFLILGIGIAFLILYVLTERKKNKFKNFLNKNPREFIINLYENAKKILSIFGLNHREIILPLSYAKLVEDKYFVQGNLFLRFTVKFEEAKYSHHIMQFNDANLTLVDYNKFLKTLLSRYNRLPLFLKYCLTLFYRKPLFIS